MATEKKSTSTAELTITTEWVFYLIFLVGLAMLYIFLSHRTDNIVRDISGSKKNLIEYRAENITLKSEIMKKKSRQSLEERLSSRGVREPNRAVRIIKKPHVD